MLKGLQAVVFSPGSSKAEKGLLHLHENHIVWESSINQEKLPESEYVMETPMRRCPLVVQLHDGRRIEVDHENYDFDSIKHYFRSHAKGLHWLENSSKALATLLLAVGMIVFVGVRYVIPAFSQSIAAQVPRSWAVALDDQIIKQLDDKFLGPSELSPVAEFGLSFYLDEEFQNEQLRILFRKHSSANAFALAGDTVIITDDLVDVLGTKERVLAVFLHELGHLKHRHVLASIISSSSLAALSVVFLGDLPGLTESLLSGGVLLASSSYSRDAEREADQFAKDALKQKGLPESCLTESFEKFKEELGSVGEALEGGLRYFSTHPTFAERLDGKAEKPCPQTPISRIQTKS